MITKTQEVHLMNNTMKNIVFIASFFSFLILYIFFYYILTIFFNNYQPPVYISYSFTAISFIIILFVQAYVRKQYVRKNLKTSSILLDIECQTIRFVDKLLLYALPVVMLLFPLLSNPVFDILTQFRLIVLLVLIFVLELLLSVAKKTMKAIITDKGIAITGIDLRLELPISANYTNGSGFYPWERIHSFLIVNNEVFIEQSFDLGIIKLTASPDQLRQLKGLLIKNGIDESRGY